MDVLPAAYSRFHSIQPLIILHKLWCLRLRIRLVVVEVSCNVRVAAAAVPELVYVTTLNSGILLMSQ